VRLFSAKAWQKRCEYINKQLTFRLHNKHGEMTMKKSNLSIVLALFLLTLGLGGLTVVAAGDTDSIMCDNGVVAIGDFFQTVQDKCGEPDKKEGKFWRYNFGPSQPVYTVEFDENGNTVRIIEDQGGSQ
jgi:hypothetical protein